METTHCWGNKCHKTYAECLRSHGVSPRLNDLELRNLAARAQVLKDIKDVYGEEWQRSPRGWK